MKLLPVVIAMTLTSQSFATLRTSDVRGDRVEHAVVNRNPELCIIPTHLPGGKYDKDDIEDEKELCSYSIGKNVAACPKEESTNPGVNFMYPRIDKGIKLSANDLQSLVGQLQDDKYCDIKYTYKKKDGTSETKGPKKLAKYKLSTSCSYAPSLLAYYHISRVLGDIVNVPPAVLRTMDLGRHIALGEEALQDLKEKKKSGELIDQTWGGLMSILKAGEKADAKRREVIFTEDYKQSFGALQVNPTKEEKYSDFFNSGADRVAAFESNNAIFKELKTRNLTVGKEFNQKNVQDMVELKDAADFILLDTIIGQQDRFGNIHYIKKYYYETKDKEGNYDIKSKAKKEKIDPALQSKAVEIKSLMLKDNDCGLSKEDRIGKAGLLEDVAHMSPETYRRLLAFEKIIDQKEVQDIFLLDYAFTKQNLSDLTKRLKAATKTVRDNCEAKKLRLDLSLDKHFSKVDYEQTATDCDPK